MVFERITGPDITEEGTRALIEAGTDDWTAQTLIEVYDAIIHNQDLDAARWLWVKDGTNQFGGYYALVRVRVEVILEFGGDIYAGSNGLMLNISHMKRACLAVLNYLDGEEQHG